MMKYIRHKEYGLVVFDASTGSHEQMADRMKWSNEEIVSAGIVCFNSMAVVNPKNPLEALYCTGRSMTLGKRSQESDTDELHLTLRN